MYEPTQQDMSIRHDGRLRSREASASEGATVIDALHHQDTRPRDDESTTANTARLNSQRFESLHDKKASMASTAPLPPLALGSGKGTLPHPATYVGDDNWAMTPNSDLPSLPGTPMRAHHALGWPLPQLFETSNRDNSTARALLLQRRIDGEGARTASGTGKGSSPSPFAATKNSPRLAQATLGFGSPGSPPSKMQLVESPTHTSSRQYAGVVPTSIANVLGNGAGTSGELRDAHKIDDNESSGSPGRFGQAARPPALSYSRLPSQARMASPAPSALSASSHSTSLRQAMPASHVYRPPHMRTDSTYALKPKMAHYDRVSATLRGQSRSPDPVFAEHLSRVPSAAVSHTSRTPSEAHSPSPRMGNRRLSRIGSFAATAQQAPDTSSGFDTKSLIAKLASAKLDMGTRSSNSPSGVAVRSDRSEEGDQIDNVSDTDDVDFTAEDMMISHGGSLTDEFYRSRTASTTGEQVQVADIFDVGDRLGPGMMHDGYEITIAETSKGFKDQHADWTGTQLEIVSKLGEGSYAVVYLVKEVPRRQRGQPMEQDPDAHNNDLEPSTLRADTSVDADATILHNGEETLSKTLQADRFGHLAGDEVNESSAGKKQFALKCLCKRDLSPAMLEVQRLEATIHQSIPPHPNIVTLYRTYETPEWLFLILEYCPGQDLFYWLEQAQDTENLGTVTPGGMPSPFPESDDLDSTPPSPGLLASTTSRFLLSRRRLRLISRMFQQICEAVTFCHERGIAHRDLKPENFIVEDTRSDHDEQGIAGGIKVKLTDFGLAVAQTRCIDFDCGSKPYMSFECRNNTVKWYDPIQSDVWSLGIVLLNLIFHRNPFKEPNAERCPSFAAYVEDPINFLTSAFRGLKREAAEYLADNVFCDVTEDGEESGVLRKRISAKEFAEWASGLEAHLEVPSVEPTIPSTPGETPSDAGADHDITLPLSHSRSPASSAVNSMLSSPMSNHRSANIHQELMSMGIPEDEIDTFTPLFGESAGVVRPRKSRGNSVARRLSDHYQDRPDSVREESEVDCGLSQDLHQEVSRSTGDINDTKMMHDGDAASLEGPDCGSPKRKKRSLRRSRILQQNAPSPAQALQIPQRDWRAATQASSDSFSPSTHGKWPSPADHSESWRDNAKAATKAQSVEHTSASVESRGVRARHSPPKPIDGAKIWVSPASEAQNWRDRSKPLASSHTAFQGFNTFQRKGAHQHVDGTASMSPPSAFIASQRPPRPLPVHAVDAGYFNGKAESRATLKQIAMPTDASGNKESNQSNIAQLFAANADQRMNKKRSVPNFVARRPAHHDRAAGGIRGGALAASLGRAGAQSPAAATVANANGTSSMSNSLAPDDQVRGTQDAPHEEIRHSDGEPALPRKKMLGKFLQGVRDSYNRNVS